MTDNDLGEAVEEIKKDIDKLIELRNKMIAAGLINSKEPEKNEDRDFQLDMLWLQLRYGLLASIMTIIFSAAISYVVAIITVSVNLPNQVALSGILVTFTIVLIAAIVGSSIVVGIIMRNEIANLRNGKTTKNKE